MKSKKIVFIALLTVGLFSCKQEKIVELPLTAQIGYGQFRSGLGGISPILEGENDPWHKTYPKISSLPESLTDIKYGFIETNIRQSVYQDYWLGNITQDWYDDLQKSWNWIPDTLSLSKTPIKTKIAFAYGKDSEGILKIVVDTNNNLDLSDDDLFIPLGMNSFIDIEDASKKDSIALSHAVNVSFEIFVNDKIVPVSVPLFITYHNQYNMFFCNFLQYATTQFKGKDILVSSGDFTDLSYGKIEVALKHNDMKNGEKFTEDDIYRKNEYIEIKNAIYRILGVNTNKSTLVLEKTGLSKSQLHSSQTGYKAHSFQGEEFTTKSAVSLEQFNGKYVLLDFWATWCGHCIREFPNLRELYAKSDTAKFVIIGIIGDSQPVTLTNAIEKHEIAWPQILSDDTNKIKEKYGITGYPTTFLINTEGIIIAKNLRGKELEEKVLSLINEANTIKNN